MERSALIGVEMMTSEFATGHATNGMDKVVVIEILEPILVQIMSVGMVIEVHRWRIFPTLLITGVL